ncbi:transient receptor potential cation channel protein painless [Monomorium pharaonis]|uniref:transient receptor potential cation channel protein painless n=1 Tax=Monomorium pharaonis TaxID=307658 RepID=UPI00063EF6FD|nr:transient receptor potential cation channel protein painless [Monomorium pharaonis]XP_036138850.1 transient receptor potential cation channel protein painless [Monomorium pharaonis]
MDLSKKAQEHIDICLNVPQNSEEVHKSLFNALRSKNFRSFKNIIEQDLKEQPPILDINYVDPNTKEACLDIASKNGLTEFVEFLLQNQAKPNREDKSKNYAPIHFATEGGHAETLKVLLFSPKSKIQINPDLRAGQDERTALHIAVKKNDRQCVKLLLDRGASINIPNSEDKTALHLAAIENNRKMVNLILKTTQQQPDGRTQEVIRQKWPDLKLEYESREIKEDDLKYYLTVEDKTNFLRSMELVEINILKNVAKELLELTAHASKRGFHNVAIRILEKLEGKQINVKKAAQAAIQESNYTILQVLLKTEPSMANDLILSACKELQELSKRSGKRGVDSIPNQLKCLKLILEQENVNVRCIDKDTGNTPLHYAASAGCQEAVILLLHRGSYIGHMNYSKIPPIADIPAHTLSRYFDDCLQIQKDTNECTIEFNYSCLMPPRNQDDASTECNKTEMEVFNYIADHSRLKHLLKHPLLSSFIDLKLNIIQHILLANITFCTVFYFLLYVFILKMTWDIQKKNKTQIANGSHSLLWAFTIVMLLLYIFREIIELMFCVKCYIASLRNWLKIMLIFFTITLLHGAGFQVGVVVILLSAYELMLNIQYNDFFSSVEMFRTISLNFIYFLLPYLPFFGAFALAFHTLFNDNDKSFTNLYLSHFKTVIMFTGEFNANDIQFKLHPIWSHIVFILFVFFIYIVLFSLLNGLAVSGTAEILSEVEVLGLISKIHLVAYIEHIKVDPCGWSFCSSLTKSFRSLADGILPSPISLSEPRKSFIMLYDNLDVYDKHKWYNVIKRVMQWRIFQNGEFFQIDTNIIKRAKSIIDNKNQLTDNEKIKLY